jgi:hypothetical protein
LLDLYLMLSKAGSQLYLFNKIVGFIKKHAWHTFQKGVTLPCCSRNSNQTNPAKAQCSSSSIHTSCTWEWNERHGSVSSSMPRISHHTSLALWTDDAGSSPGSLSVWQQR